MSDLKSVLERGLRGFEPSDDAFERTLRRRDRKRRNQRITAGVVGIAVFVAAVWIVTVAGSFDRTTTPADKPTEKPAGKTAEDVARDFLYETAFFETDLAVRHLASDAAVWGLGLEGIGEFRRWLSFNEATGFEVIPTSCEETASSSRGTYVRCTYDFHWIRSEAIGRGPYSGGYFDLLVADPIIEYGRILEVRANLEFRKFGPQMWDPFDEWVSTNYPEDAAVMYNSDHTDYQLSKESIRLWEQRSREYVETGPAETAPPPAGASAAPDLVGQEMCSAGASARLEVTDIGARLYVQFEVFRGHPFRIWRVVIHRRHQRIDPPPPWGQVLFRGTRRTGDPMSDVGHFRVRLVGRLRGVPDTFARYVIDAKATDTQTGEVCRVLVSN